MSNHIKTVVKITEVENIEEAKSIVNMLASPPNPDKSCSLDEYILDFNKIIHEPETKDECPKEFLLKDSVSKPITVRKDKPWFNWYDWHIRYWNTKWNAYQGYTIIENNQVTFVFNTAWEFADKVLKRLHLLGYPITILYADEDTKNDNAGVYEYLLEKQIWEYTPPSDFDDGEHFSEKIWDKY